MTTAFLAHLLAWACLAWYATIWSICLLGLSIAWTYYMPPVPPSPLSHAHEGSPDPEVPGLTIIRPLSGLDYNLFANLCSAFELQYPKDKLEILMSVKHESDQALRVAREVKERYPGVKSGIIVGDEDAGVNPKINNLVRPFAQATFDLIWVLDSQVWLPPGAAGRAVQTFLLPPPPRFLRRRPHGARIGLVHHVPLGVNAMSAWGSQIERVFLSTTHAKMYLAINALAIDSCVMGKSNIYRKSDLGQVPDDFFGVDASGSRGEAGAIGSRAFSAPRPKATHPTQHDGVTSVIKTTARPLARFGIYLAEDNMLALSLWRAPLHLAHAIAQGDVAHTTVGDIATLQAYAERRMRWIRVRKHMVAAATYAEPFTESIIAGMLGLYAFRYFALPSLLTIEIERGGYSAWISRGCTLVFLASHFSLWHLVDRGVLFALSGGNPLPKDEQLLFTAAWVLRELLALPIWLWAILGSTGKPKCLPPCMEST
ncbi:glycosyltransferase family 21 protein [Tilletiaria anomala UBC 951]|uniref:Ceramide glucosyltransferase n=1 Tax=Tilletiaria anomala (strain ATCC 24038 / CBS 436.72 / UBC 951) TaxID=1037660 RepID=A0A066VWU9_TILAU|nr:glycosyltransferase family 21 protein [Tilletiaria anomala UBC 951]KDN45946.1 glycosyltransferase family 21 protein [Tilletiaria anomala UBC 951]